MPADAIEPTAAERAANRRNPTPLSNYAGAGQPIQGKEYVVVAI
jgi:hypothetical protein